MGQGRCPGSGSGAQRSEKVPRLCLLRLLLGTDVEETCNHGWNKVFFVCVVGKGIRRAAQYLWAWFLMCAKLGLVDQDDGGVSVGCGL